VDGGHAHGGPALLKAGRHCSGRVRLSWTERLSVGSAIFLVEEPTAGGSTIQALACS